MKRLNRRAYGKKLWMLSTYPYQGSPNAIQSCFYADASHTGNNSTVKSDFVEQKLEDIRKSFEHTPAFDNSTKDADKDCILADIRESLATENIVAFIKGTPEQPLCGFSKRAVDILDAIQVEYVSFNVLAHPSISTGARAASQWQTFPQVFIKGDFIGGCDVLIEIAKNGDIFKILEKHKLKHNKVTFS